MARRYRHFGPTLWSYANVNPYPVSTHGTTPPPTTNQSPTEKVGEVREERADNATASDVGKQHLEEPREEISGTLPKELANPPGFLGKVYEWILKSSVCPQPLFALSAALVLCGTIFGRKIRSSLGQRTNLFVINVGKTSSGKDYPREAVLSVLDAAGAGHLWREKVTSAAAIESALSAEPNLLLAIDEAGHFFRTAKAKGNGRATIKPALLELWSRAEKIWKGDERGQGVGCRREVVVVDSPCVCFLGSSQPEILFDGVTKEDLQDGWLQRILFFCSDAMTRPEIKESVEIPPEIVTAVRKWTDTAKEAVLRFDEPPPSPLAVPITDDAKAVLSSFANEAYDHTASDSPFGVLYGKANENAIRVALILAVARHVDDPENAVITAADVTYATELVRFLLLKMEELLKANLAENNAERNNKRLLQIVRESGTQGVTTSELTAKTRWLRGASRREILNELVASGDVREHHLPNGGSLFVATTDGTH